MDDIATLNSAATAAAVPTDTERCACCIQTSKRIRWDIKQDGIRKRSFDFDKRFLPESLARVFGLACLSAAEKRLLNQAQGLTYAIQINDLGPAQGSIGRRAASRTPTTTLHA